MSDYYMELRFQVSGDLDGLEEHLDCVLDSLYEDARISDADYMATLEQGEVTFSFSVNGEDDLDGMTSGVGAMRAAIHAAEGFTPGWEEHFKRMVAAIRDADELVDA